MPSIRNTHLKTNHHNNNNINSTHPTYSKIDLQSFTQKKITGSFELFRKDSISVYYTSSDMLPLNRLKYRAHFFCLDSDYDYTPFCHDFGPPNLSYIHTFSKKMESRISNSRMKRIYLYSSKGKEKVSNSLVLVGSYILLHYPHLFGKFIKNISSLPLIKFRDALSNPITIRAVSVLDCLKGFKLALKFDWFNLASFDPICYNENALVENGDRNWIVPNKFLAFMGPVPTSTVSELYGFPLYTCEDHANVFKSLNVKLVIQLNETLYDTSKFVENGIKHVDLIFPDNSVPPMDIVTEFLKITEAEPGIIAVHCKQGLGRTGTLIACYLIKHYGFSAKQATGYLRLCRPGSVIAIQQRFLESFERGLKMKKRLVESGVIIPSAVPRVQRRTVKRKQKKVLKKPPPLLASRKRSSPAKQSPLVHRKKQKL